jgi:flagellar biosynthesis protein FliQ
VNQDVVISLATEAIMLALKVAGPMLIVGLVIGLAVSVFQAVTQIQEMTLTFIPKVIGLVLVVVVAGPWMLSQLLLYTTELYAGIPELVGR